LSRALAMLQRELAWQILPDGGHIARNPSVHHDVLRDLVAIRQSCLAGGLEMPETLQHAIDRMAPMLRFFRHGDGGLALFHGSREMELGAPDLTLLRADAKGAPLASAPHS